MTRTPYARLMADTGKPKFEYERAADGLRAKIKSGEYPPGTRLPAKPALADLLGVRQGALTRGLDDLRREGLVETRQGAGTFACQPPEREPSPECTGPGKRLAAVEERVRQLEGRLEEVERLVRGRP